MKSSTLLPNLHFTDHYSIPTHRPHIKQLTALTVSYTTISPTHDGSFPAPQHDPTTMGRPSFVVSDGRMDGILPSTITRVLGKGEWATYSYNVGEVCELPSDVLRETGGSLTVVS